MADTPELLDALLRVPAPSGYEAPASAVWREAASFADVRTDGLGSSMAFVGPEDGEPLVAIAGHLDEIGLVVTHIDDKGFIWFQPIGGWDPQILVGQRVEIATKDGPVRCRRPQADPPARGGAAQEGRRAQAASTSTSAPRTAMPRASSSGSATLS